MAKPLATTRPNDGRPCVVVPFPLARRIGRAREVAAKLANKTCQRASVAYENQVRDGFQSRWRSVGLPEKDFPAGWNDFRRLVQRELARLDVA